MWYFFIVLDHLLYLTLSIVVKIRMVLINSCSCQDSTVFGCWIDVDWYKGWKIFHATCLSRFRWVEDIWVDASQWSGLWTSKSSRPRYDLDDKFFQIQRGWQWLWRGLDSSNWCAKWEVNIFTSYCTFVLSNTSCIVAFPFWRILAQTQIFYKNFQWKNRTMNLRWIRNIMSA